MLWGWSGSPSNINRVLSLLSTYLLPLSWEPGNLNCHRNLTGCMGKGRKLTTSRSERFLGSYSDCHGQGITSSASEELTEDEVWSMMGDAGQQSTEGDSVREWSARTAADSYGTHSSGSRRLVARNCRGVGGLSLGFEETGKSTATASRILDRFDGCDDVATSGGRNMATSAHVNLPDWSKILHVYSAESRHDSDDGSGELGSDSEVVPPHVYLARSRTMGAASVFEGVGRTLKGRDLSRVRDAVWSQTGFNG